MTTTIIIILVSLALLFFFYRRLKAKREAIKQEVIIEKVKAATYILCPVCGAHLEING